MKIEQNINIPTKGMDTDSHPSRLGQESYVFALNTAIEEYVGNGTPMLQNEPSNILCSKFKEGYRVVGFKSHLPSNRVYFFLTNPANGRSEIGFIEGTPQMQSIEEAETYCGCDLSVVLQSLEDNITKLTIPTCKYQTLIGDNCTDENGNFKQEKPCLNFSLKYPIKEGNIIIKTEKVGIKMYWTDGLNPPRFFDSYLHEEKNYYNKTGLTSCGVDYDVKDVCVDCEKLNVFHGFAKPCLAVESVVTGGNLNMGIYQYMIAYSDSEGNELSPYFSMTNPVTLFNEGKHSMSDSDLNAPSGKGVALKVTNLDTSFKNYKIITIRRNDAHFTENYLTVGVYPVSVDKVFHDREDASDIPLTRDRIVALRNLYKKANIMASSGGYLFQAGLKTQEEVNLQPVVNLMGGFLQWKSALALEDLYKDGANVSNYQTYLRDEVYPFGLKFQTNDGFITAVFPLVPPPPTKEAVANYSGLNYESVNRFGGNCEENKRTKYWQFENTAKVDGKAPSNFKSCVDDPTGCEEIEDVQKSVCSIEVYRNEEETAWSFKPSQNFIDLAQEIVNNPSIIKDNNPALYDKWVSKFPDFNCEPTFLDFEGVSCKPYEVTGSKMMVDEYEEKERVTQPAPIEDYSLIQDLENNEEDYVETDAFSDGVFMRDNNGRILDDRSFVESFISHFDKDTTDDRGSLSYPFGCVPKRRKVDNSTSVDVKRLCKVKPMNTEVTVNNGNKFYGGIIRHTTQVFFNDEADSSYLNHPVRGFLESYNTKCNLNEGKLITSLLSVNSGKNFSAGSEFVKDAAHFNGAFVNKFSKSVFQEEVDVVAPYSIADLKAIMSNATWLKVGQSKTEEPVVLDFSKDETQDVDFRTAEEIRVSIFKTCEDTHAYRSVILKRNEGGLLMFKKAIPFDNFGSFPTVGKSQCVYIDKSTSKKYIWNVDTSLYVETTEEPDFYENESVFIAIDTQLIPSLRFNSHVYKAGELTIPRKIGMYNKNRDFLITYSNRVLNNFKVAVRNTVYSKVNIVFKKMVFRKNTSFERKCKFLQKDISSCGVIPSKKGYFGYYESIETYPDNEQLYDSSKLKISTDDIPEVYKKRFSQIYTDGKLGKNYVLKPQIALNGENYGVTDLRCKPIRHFKFPSNAIEPFVAREKSNTLSTINVLGVHIDNDVINTFLDIAVKNNLITQSFRDSIVSYEIVRGDRTLDKSIIMRGLLYDVYRYDEGANKALYANYPYNDLGSDFLNSSTPEGLTSIRHPHGGVRNNNFTFHSPDTHFYYVNVLPREIQFDGYLLGSSRGMFAEVEGHPKWVILGERAFRRAENLARLEILFEQLIELANITSQTRQFQIFGLANGVDIPVWQVAAAAAMKIAYNTFGAQVKRNRYALQWLESFKNLGDPQNFAYYYSSVGNYDTFLQHDKQGNSNSLRGLQQFKYLKQGNHFVKDYQGNDFMFNNTDREFTHYLSLGNYFFNYNPEYVTWDNSDKNIGSRFTLGTVASDSRVVGGRSREFIRNIGSPYVTLKTFLFSQYGLINSVRWVDTGYCGMLNQNNSFDIAFGGDTYISRFSFKRKIPMFYINAMGTSDLTPFGYRSYRNIGYPRFYVDTDTATFNSDDYSMKYPNFFVAARYDTPYGLDQMYVLPPSKIYLFYYGIASFLVESTVNCNYRYGGPNDEQRFYPNISDYISWTQEKNVSIKSPEFFAYNDVYSKRSELNGLNRMLSIEYDKNYWDRSYNMDNVVIYSKPDASEVDRFDPWRVYRANDKHQFPTANGKLVDIRGIESEQILVRFENTYEIHNAINQYKDAMNANTEYTGTGSLFAGRPINFQSSEIGYGGTQHKAMVSTEFGHVWADAMRGEVLMVDSNGRNLQQITTGKRHWFKEHLPFKIIKHVKDMTHMDCDNNFIGLGIIFGYDSRFKRIFMTKRDYVPTKLAKEKSVRYDKESRSFFVKETDNSEIEVSLQDARYFEDASFTMAYSFLTQSWISYYSFTPDYYINHQNYFQTGVNVDKGFGLWSHLLTNKSYQVFYGEKFPWTVEMPFKNNMMNKTLNAVSYWLDSRRYHNDYDFAEKRNEGFNKAYVYNHSQNSGLLELNVAEKNNFFQQSSYPKMGDDSMQILTTENDKRWSFNYFFNEVRNEFNNNPIWLWDVNSITKKINKSALDYRRPFKERLRGDWFTVMLTQDKDTRFKYILKWVNTQDNYYKN